MKGTLKAKAPISSTYIEHGPMPARFSIGYLDGVRPSLVSTMLNRDWRRNFHIIVATYSFNDNKEFVMNWSWDREASGHRCDDGHHNRISDVDFDGKDEIHEIGFVLNGDGSLRYTLTTSDYDQLIIYTTNKDTDFRLTSLSQDPGMRSSMSLNGYKQSHMSLMYMATDIDINKERDLLKTYLARRAGQNLTPNDPGNQGNKKKGLSAGAIVGIVFAVIVVIAAVIVGVIFFLKKKRNDDSGLLFRPVN